MTCRSRSMGMASEPTDNVPLDSPWWRTSSYKADIQRCRREASCAFLDDISMRLPYCILRKCRQVFRPHGNDYVGPATGD